MKKIKRIIKIERPNAKRATKNFKYEDVVGVSEVIEYVRENLRGEYVVNVYENGYIVASEKAFGERPKWKRVRARKATKKVVEIKGTEKQVKWAENIKKENLEKIDSLDTEEFADELTNTLVGDKYDLQDKIKFLRLLPIMGRELKEELLNKIKEDSKKWWENVSDASKIIEHRNIRTAFLREMSKEDLLNYLLPIEKEVRKR